MKKEKIEINFVYKYNIEKKLFSIYDIVITHDGYLPSGKKIEEMHEKVSRNNDYLETDINAIEKGFFVCSPMILNNGYNAFKERIEAGYLFPFTVFRPYLKEGDIISLYPLTAEFNEEEITKVKEQHFLQMITLGLPISLLLNKTDKEEIENLQKVDNTELKLEDIINILTKRIKGQNVAIFQIAPAILANQDLIDLDEEDLTRTQKFNILVDGPSGCGKTLIVEELSKLLNIPITIVNPSNYSSAGYVGDDLKTILVSLLKQTDDDLEKAQRGIICFDEIDKLGNTDLDMRKAISEELLTWMNGAKISLNYKGKNILFDTKNITFIGLGAFEKLRENEKNNRPIGFENIKQKNGKRQEFDTEDYIKFGMPRELMGRFNHIITLNELTKEDYKAILLDSEISPLSGFVSFSELYGTEITFDESFVDEIIERAIKLNISARGLLREINKIRTKYLRQIMNGEIERLNLTEREFLSEEEIILKRALALNS